MSLNLVLDYERSALAAPQSFRDAMQAAANILDSLILDNITVTILVGYGDWNNGADTGLTTGAEASDLLGHNWSYTNLRAALARHVTDNNDQTFVNSLPTTSSVNGHSSFYVPSAVEKALGLLSATNSAVDGAVGMGTQIPSNLEVGVALHELTHAMGRENGVGPFDLFRYTSPGVHLFSSSSTAPAAYFSIDGGNTQLANFGQSSDPSDFLNSGVQGSNDPFNELYSNSTFQNLTAVDKELLDILGFNISSGINKALVPNEDFNGDGTSDILWQHNKGDVYIWEMKGGQISSGVELGVIDTSWHIQGTGDFNGDGSSDVLWRKDTGNVYIWEMKGGQISSGVELGVTDTSWHIQGTGDFNGDGSSDVLWHKDNGNVYIWEMKGSRISFGVELGVTNTSWHIQGTGDFNGDGSSDVLWRTDSGDTRVWVMNGGQINSDVDCGVVATSWHIQGTGDYDGDGKSDILWRNDSGDTHEWLMNGGQISSVVELGPTDTHWNVSYHSDIIIV